MTTMRAMLYDRFGPPAEVLRMGQAARPEPGAGEVLVEVYASSANPYDWHFIRAEPYFIRLAGSGLIKPKLPIPGGDLAGRVAAVGDGVERFSPGDEVYAFHHGAFAEYIAVPEKRLATKPRNLSFLEAAAVPLGAVTALQGLRDQGEIAKGDRVLIVGASGGVGTFAVQMAVAFGTEVTGVCSGRHVELVRSLGAAEVIEYTTTDFTTLDRTYDLVLQLGGTYSPRAIRRVMAPNGRLVLAMGDGSRALGPIARIAMALLLNPFVSQTMKTFTAQETGEVLEEIREMIEAGTVRPVIDSTVPLESAGRAVALVEDGSPAGKIVISIGADPDVSKTEPLDG